MRYCRSTTIKVDLMAGTDIMEACVDIIELANRFQTKVETSFNDVILLARPGDNPITMANDWDRELKSEKPFKMAKG